MNETNQLEKILKINFERIKAVDIKNGLLLSANSFVLTAISFLQNILGRQWIITMVIMLSISLFFFVVAIVPIFWNKKRKKEK